MLKILDFVIHLYQRLFERLFTGNTHTSHNNPLLRYRKYIIPYGTSFVNAGADITFMFILNSSIDGEDHVNVGYNPNFGFGYIVEMFNKSIIVNLNAGYLIIPNKKISGIAFDELPHGVNMNITFGIHKRNFSKRSILMPE